MRRAWGNGHATEEAPAWPTHDLATLGLSEIAVVVRLEHPVSIRVLGKLGVA